MYDAELVEYWSVTNADEDTARQHGVRLELRPDWVSYMPRRARAICMKTGKVIRNDNEIWVRKDLFKYQINIVEEILC